MSSSDEYYQNNNNNMNKIVQALDTIKDICESNKITNDEKIFSLTFKILFLNVALLGILIAFVEILKW